MSLEGAGSERGAKRSERKIFIEGDHFNRLS